MISPMGQFIVGCIIGIVVLALVTIFFSGLLFTIDMINESREMSKIEDSPGQGQCRVGELPDLPDLHELPPLETTSEQRAPTLPPSQPPVQAPEPPHPIRTFYRARQEGPFVPGSLASMQRRFEALKHCGFAANEFAL